MAAVQIQLLRRGTKKGIKKRAAGWLPFGFIYLQKSWATSTMWSAHRPKALSTS